MGKYDQTFLEKLIFWGGILLLLFIIGWPAYAETLEGEDLDLIRNSSTVLVCKPIVDVDGVKVIGDQESWVILTWSQLEKLERTDRWRAIFKTKDGRFTLPTDGYICTLA